MDELVNLPSNKHATLSNDTPLYVAYQKPVEISEEEVLARTFEDALVLSNFNHKFFKEHSKLKDIISEHENNSLKTPLAEALYDFVQGLTKGNFAFDCLMHLAMIEERIFEPPAYIKDGLDWLSNKLEPKSGS